MWILFQLWLSMTNDLCNVHLNLNLHWVSIMFYIDVKFYQWLKLANVKCTTLKKLVEISKLNFHIWVFNWICFISIKRSFANTHNVQLAFQIGHYSQNNSVSIIFHPLQSFQHILFLQHIKENHSVSKLIIRI